MYTHKHIVNYYETDRMGITHHSNYVRWMEEARVAYLNEIGWSYVRCEAMGIMSPVIGIDCKYIKSTTFADEVFIDVYNIEFTGLKLKLAYRMKNANGEIINEATSLHCFTSPEGKLLRIKKDCPEMYDALYNGSIEDRTLYQGQ